MTSNESRGATTRLVLLIAALSACVSAPERPRAQAAAATPQKPQPTTNSWPIRQVANPPQPYRNVDQTEAPPPALVSVIRNLGQSFRGKVGIAVRRVGAD